MKQLSNFERKGEQAPLPDPRPKPSAEGPVNRRLRCGCVSHNGFLTGRGYALAAQRSLERSGLDATEALRYLDSVGSVSADESSRGAVRA